MKNAKLIIIWSTLLAVLILAGIGVFLWENEYFVNKNVAVATTQRGEVLHIVNGEAIAITWQAPLVAGESIQTLEGESLITINENHFLWLKPNSKVTLNELDKENIVFTLDKGDVWYMHVSSTDSQKFTLKTALSTIEPKGTKFYASFDDVLLTTSTFVVEGTVKVSDDFIDLDLEAFEKSYKTDVDGLVKVGLDAIDKEIAKYQIERDYAILKSARTAEINRHETILNIVKDKFNVTDEIIQDTLAKLDSGELSEEQLLEQSPVPIVGVDRIRELNVAAKKTLMTSNALLTR